MGIHSSFIKGVAVSVAVVFGVSLASAAGAQDAAAAQNPLTVPALQTNIEAGTDKQVVPLFTGPRRTLVQITLLNGATPEAHKAPEPITLVTQFTER